MAATLKRAYGRVQRRDDVRLTAARPTDRRPESVIKAQCPASVNAT